MSSLTETAKNGDLTQALKVALASAISVSIGLYWSDILQDMIKQWVPDRTSTLWLIAGGIVLTVVGVLIIYALFAVRI